MTLRYLTAGESHGKALVGILEGLPAGLALSAADIQADLLRRKKGHGRGNRQKIEGDQVEILSGIRAGKTLGSPLGLLIPNQDFKNWEGIMGHEPTDKPSTKRVDVPRPGHADLVGKIKYGFDDMRNVLERASARETAMRVALGGAARKLLLDLNIHVASRVVAIGGETDDSAVPCPVAELNALTDADPVRCANPNFSKRMVARIDQAKAAGDTVGGLFEVLADGLPVGLGSYAQWDRRLEGPLSAALMSLNAIKGVEVGFGFRGAGLPGSQAHDAYEPKGKKVGYRSNRSGGLDGGMTTGQTLVLRAAMKPIATLMEPLDSVDLRTMKPAKAHVERSDACAVPAAAVIAESLACLVLANAVLEKFGGDSMRELVPRIEAWRR
ncbi:MAG: chorismate synthase [Elusimicrobiota bacterium]|nr:MAG: chorismate synthase [Elusimicrobiota bacterium]